MRKIKAIALAGAAFLATSLPLSAGAGSDFKIPVGTRVYLCDFKVGARDKTTPEKALVMIDKAGKITAYDGLMGYAGLGPQPATAMVDNDRRVTWGWTVPGGKDELNQFTPGLEVRLTLQKADNSALITVVPLGYMKKSARGSCESGIIRK